MPVVVLTILSSSPHQNGILLQSGSQNTANNALYGDMGLQEGGGVGVRVGGYFILPPQVFSLKVAVNFEGDDG